MGIFYREKAFHAGKKIRKNDFAPSEKYACYAPVKDEEFISNVDENFIIYMWYLNFSIVFNHNNTHFSIEILENIII